MTTLRDRAVLGRTGLRVGRLGISSSYGAPAAAFEAALDEGQNYWTWGTFIKGRSSAMRDAVQSIVRMGRRDDLVLGVITYAHWPSLTAWRLRRGLKALGTDYADVLLLGYYSQVPSRRTLDAARKLRDEGLIRHIGVTGHRRAMFQDIEADSGIDVIHVRYNAVHRGAEEDVFPFVAGPGGPGVVSFTATDWGHLLQSKRMPPGDPPLTAPECYRFALSHPAVDVCMIGPRDEREMQEDLAVLDQEPLDENERGRIVRIGDHLYGR